MRKQMRHHLLLNAVTQRLRPARSVVHVRNVRSQLQLLGSVEAPWRSQRQLLGSAGAPACLLRSQRQLLGSVEAPALLELLRNQLEKLLLGSVEAHVHLANLPLSHASPQASRRLKSHLLRSRRFVASAATVHLPSVPLPRVALYPPCLHLGADLHQILTSLLNNCNGVRKLCPD